MNEKEFLKQIIADTKVKLNSEFDKNFERKAFFDKKWAETKHPNNRGSLMMRSGKLRRGNIAKINQNGIEWSNSMPYADLHNNGGEIKVTQKIKKYFWAMYYKSTGAISEKGSNQRNTKLTEEASRYKAMALMKVGKKIKIDQRQFLGHHPMIDVFVKDIINHNFTELSPDFVKKFNFK